MSRTRWILSVCALCVVASLSLGVGGCPLTPPAIVGDATAGETKFNSTCSGCHTATAIAPDRNLIRANMGTINSAMSGITLTNQEIADLKAFLATQ
jgi:mono/diheme cytochrome c family protein